MLSGDRLPSCEQPFDRCHRQKEALVVTFGWETLEPVVLVEGSRVIVYGIGDNRDGGDLAGGRQRASQGIQKQSPPEPLALVRLVYRHQGVSLITLDALGVQGFDAV
jgi:hypothetical protein